MKVSKGFCFFFKLFNSASLLKFFMCYDISLDCINDEYQTKMG